MLSTILVLALGMVPQDPYMFEPAGKNFRVELPARPDRTSSRPVKNAAGVSQLTAAQVRTGDATYSVQVTENPANVDPNTLDEGIRRFATVRKATLGAVSTISIGANPGRDFEILESTSEGLKRSKMRWVTSENKLLMLSVAANPGRALPADANRFFDSLEIGGAKAPGAVARNEPVGTQAPEPAAPAVEVVKESEPAPEVSAEPVVDDEAESRDTEAAKPSSKSAARKASSKVTLSPIPRNAKRHAADDVVDLQRAFLGADRDGFRDLGPAGALLVGVRVSYIEHFGGPKIRSAQPIYREGNKYYVGQIHGQVVDPVTTAIARPGYAVGGLVTHTGLAVDGFRLVFMRVNGNRLDPNDSYNSPWLGDEKGGGPGEVMSKGELIIGLQGRSGPEVFALGLTSLR